MHLSSEKSEGPFPWRVAAGIWLAGLLAHLIWPAITLVPWDWDAMYYRLVASHILNGDGAVHEAIWSLFFAPTVGPVTADVHWMPLPSRVLLPGMWLSPEWGGPLTSVLLSSFVGPLTWLFARRMTDLPERYALLAGLLASLGGFFSRGGSETDCYALYAVARSSDVTSARAL